MSLISQSINLEPQGDFVTLETITVSSLLSASIVLILIVTTILFFFSLLVGGLKWILSGGKKEKTENAKLHILNALIGLMIVFSTWAIMQLINSFFGIDIFQFDFIPAY